MSTKYKPPHLRRERRQRVKPNYFVCIPISTPGIHEGLKALQDHLVSKCPLAESALTPLATLHVTFMVMHLADEKQVIKACSVLDDVTVKINRLLSQSAQDPFFTVEGLGTFPQGVLFAEIGHRELLGRIANEVRTVYERNGIPPTDTRDFKPHATILFLKKENLDEGIKKIDPSWYAGQQDTQFGRQDINKILLCSMDKPRHPETQFYHIEHSRALMKSEDEPFSNSNTTSSCESNSKSVKPGNVQKESVPRQHPVKRQRRRQRQRNKMSEQETDLRKNLEIEALKNMFNSWYLSGYHYGYFQALNKSKK